MGDGAKSERCRGLDRHGLETAVDDDFRASDEAARRRICEEEGCADEFFGFAKSVHGGVPHDRLDPVGSEHFAVLFGGEEAWDNEVDAHALSRPFPSDILGEIGHRGFGSGVGEDAGKREAGRRGTYVDNRTAVGGLEHVFAEDLTGKEDAFDVGRHDVIELVFGDFEQRGGGVHASPVDQDIDATGASKDGFAQGGEISFTRRVGGVKPRLAPGGFDFLKAGSRFGLIASD